MSNLQTRIQPVAALLVAATLSLGLAQTAAADVKSETRTTGDFSRISTGGAFELEVTAGQPSASVVISADSDLLPEIKTEVRGDELRISMEGDHFFTSRHSGHATIKIAVPKLSGISASGSTTIAASNLAGDNFEMRCSGSTKAVLRGTVDRLAIKVSGSGHVDAGALTTKSAEIHSSGSSDVEVNASDRLSVSSSGASKVRYAGHPAISQHVTGSSDITARN